MRNEHTTAEDSLKKISVEHLSGEERAHLWSSVTTAHARTPRVVPSPYSGWIISRFTHSYSMITAAIALMLALSAGATVVAADDSRPGDALFAIDRATENVRIALAGDDTKDELRIRFAEERATEVESIIDEEGERVRLAMETRAQSSEGTSAEFTMQAKVASDDASTSDDDSNDSDSDSDDDADDADDDSDDDDGDERIANGLSVAIGYLTEVSAELEAKGNIQAKESVDAVIARLNSKIGEIPEELRVRLKLDNEGEDSNLRIRVRSEGEGDDDDGVEVRGDGVRTKVEFKNGEIRIESRMDDDSDDDSDDDDDSSSAALEVEADVFTDKTIVKVERNGIKELFTTTAKTRAEVVAAIAVKFGMTEAEVDAVLDFEIENRASVQSDLFLSGSSEDDSDNSDDDSSDDSEGSKSGSGSGFGGGFLGGLLGDDSDDDSDDDDSDDDSDDDDDDDDDDDSDDDDDDDDDDEEDDD